MAHEWSRRSVLGAAAAAVVVPALAAVQAQEKPAAKEKSAAAKGKLTEESLGTLLKAMGVEAKLSEKRYDFEFKSVIAEEEWVLSMSTVLSQDGNSIWIMAWLDELPKSPADVPRTALLRLLSDNDKLGKGTFFAYIVSNRRFVLQRVIPNESLTTAAFRAELDDLGACMADTYSHWSVANWNSTKQEDPANAPKSGQPVKGSAPQAAAKTGKPAQQAINDPKFRDASRK
ncbi:MAG: type III secretion system chaperone [Planctomycetaceae bacterium]